MHDPVGARTTTYEQAYPGGWDIGIRLKDMDREGIDHSVVYTSLGLFLGGDGDPLLTGALCRAYNNWISDFCKQAPDRLSALAIVPLMDIEASVAETRRAIEQLGLKGVMVRPNPYQGRMLHDPAYGPFWRELQGLGVPVAFHDAAVGNIPFAGADRCKTSVGVADPYGLAWAFTHIVSHPHELAAMQPTEGEEADMESVLRFVGDDRVVWASDYPHFDCKLPGTLGWTNHSGLSEEVLEKLLGKNAAALYDLKM